MADLLRQHAINPTHQTSRDAYALFSRQEHLSADQILAIVNTKHSETSKATVYNTLNLSWEKKLIREVIVDPSKVFLRPQHPRTSSFLRCGQRSFDRYRCSGFQDQRLARVAAGVITEGIGYYRPYRLASGCRLIKKLLIALSCIIVRRYGAL